MANEFVISSYDGVVTKIIRLSNGQWEVFIEKTGGGSVTYILDTVMVLPCQAIKPDDIIGTLDKGDAITTVEPFKLLGNPFGTRQRVREIPIRRFLQFTDGGELIMNLTVVEVYFEVVNDNSGPKTDDLSFVLLDAQGNPVLGKKLDIYREGDYIYPVRDYSYDDVTTGRVTLTIAMEFQESFFIRAWPPELFELLAPVLRDPSIIIQPPPQQGPCGFPYTLPIVFGDCSGQIQPPPQQQGFPYTLPIIL